MASKEEVAFVGVRIWGFRSRPSVCLGWSGISQMFRAEEVDCARAWRQERAVLAIDKDCRKTCVVGRESRGQRDRQQRDLKRSAKVWLHHEGTGGTLSSFQAVSSGEFSPAPTRPDLWPLPLVSRRWCLSSWNVLGASLFSWGPWAKQDSSNVTWDGDSGPGVQSACRRTGSPHVDIRKEVLSLTPQGEDDGRSVLGVFPGLRSWASFLGWFFFFCHGTCGITVSQPKIAVKVPSPDHWTARELLD